MSKHNAVMSEFYCTQCGRKGLPIWRKTGAEREGGHLKKIFCLNCQQETNHVECKPFTKYSYEDFKIEYEYANFNDAGKRVRTYGELRSLINNGQAEKSKIMANGGDSRIRKEYLDSES